MDVVVDQPVAVLQVLTLRDAVGGNQQVNLALGRHVGRALFGARGEGRQHAAHALAKAGQGGLNASAAGDQCSVNAQCGFGPGCEVGVQVLRGV